MQSTSITPWQTCYYYIPNHFNYLKFHNKTLLFPSLFSHIPSTSTNKSLITLSSTHSTSCQQEQENHKNKSDQHRQNHLNLQELYSSVEIQKPHQTKDKNKQETAMITHSSNKTNSWWAGFKAALGQRINVQGVSSSVRILYKEQHLIIPHAFVKDIRYIDWAELKNRGFQGVIFDKDNTITVPYSLNLWAPLASSIDECKSLFGDNIAVFSNSAGLDEYDPDGRKARILERAIGIKVIRHRVKKPAGTAEEIERQFGCESARLIMVGDRPFTDIVYGNRNGFLTILTEPLSLLQEPFIVKQVRILEMALVNRWSRKGIKPISHRLLLDCQQSVKDEPL